MRQRLPYPSLMSKLRHYFARGSNKGCTLHVYEKELRLWWLTHVWPVRRSDGAQIRARAMLASQCTWGTIAAAKVAPSQNVYESMRAFMEMESPPLKPFDKVDTCLNSLITRLLLQNADEAWLCVCFRAPLDTTTLLPLFWEYIAEELIRTVFIQNECLSLSLCDANMLVYLSKCDRSAWMLLTNARQEVKNLIWHCLASRSVQTEEWIASEMFLQPCMPGLHSPLPSLTRCWIHLQVVNHHIAFALEMARI